MVFFCSWLVMKRLYLTDGESCVWDTSQVVFVCVWLVYCWLRVRAARSGFPFSGIQFNCFFWSASTKILDCTDVASAMYTWSPLQTWLLRFWWRLRLALSSFKPFLHQRPVNSYVDCRDSTLDLPFWSTFFQQFLSVVENIKGRENFRMNPDNF
jgi:hypothetical protein